jgi:acetyl-CoA carboxylase biotin carboxylase subunit
MEMNTRLQVEHGVTEMVTGMDIVQWQIRVAAGIELNRTQEQVYFHGHAIECRINAEDPDNNYRPSCGKVTALHVPGGSFVRFDTALFQDYVIPPFYDSMIGKVIVQGRTRELAIRKMKMALSELNVRGVKVNRDLMVDILCDEEFVDGSYTTDFMEDFEKRK